MSKKENNNLLERAKSLIQGVQGLQWTREQIARVKASRKVIAEGKVELARKAEANPEPGNIPAGGEWVRWWDAEKNAEFFQDPASKQTAWFLPAGKPFRDGDDLSKANPRPVPTTATFQGLGFRV